MMEPAQTLGFGSFALHPAERLLLKDGRVVPLTPKAFDLLAVLVRNAGRLLSKDELMEKVWPDTFVEESNLAYNVFTIRKALGEDSEVGRYIETVPRRGYRFVAPIALINSDGRGAEAPAVAPAVTAPGVEDASARSGTFEEEPATAPSDRHALMNRGNGPDATQARRTWLPWGAAAVSLLALAGLAVMHFGEIAVPPQRMRSVIPVVVQLLESNPFSVSPDGRHLAFSGIGADGIARLWVQDLETLNARPVPGTESKVFVAPPFWSPDSAFIAYGTVGQLMKVSVSGGAPQPVCQQPGLTVGGAWGESVIVMGSSEGGLLTCPALGGPLSQASLITTVTSGSADEIHVFPSFLPDRQHFLYTRVSRTAPETSGLFVGSLAQPAAQQSGDRLIATGFGAAYVAGAGSTPGRILFVRNSALFAQTFDPRRLKPVGDPMPVASPVGSYLDYAFFSVSTNGVLVFKEPDPDVQLTWFDRQRRVTGLVGKPGRYTSVALSPDGTRAVAVKDAPQSTADQDLWWFELSRSAESRKLTFGPLLERSPTWADDRDRIVFGSGGGQSGVYEIAVSGTEPPRLLFRTGHTESPLSVSPGSGVLLFGDDNGTTGSHLWASTLGGKDPAEPRLFISRAQDEVQGQFSPNGQWVAYVSNESGPHEVFVASSSPDPATGARVGPGSQISQGGGTSPRWRRDGRELFYLSADGTVMAVDIGTANGFHAGAATALFQVSGALPDWGVSPDGKHFLFAVSVGPPPPFSVIVNWEVGMNR